MCEIKFLIILVVKAFLFNVSGNPASRDAEQKYMKEAAKGRIEAHRVCRVMELQSLAFQSCHKVT